MSPSRGQALQKASKQEEIKQTKSAKQAFLRTTAHNVGTHQLHTTKAAFALIPK